MGAIVVMPNQSMLDVIVQGCGSLEAGMQFCIGNGVAISDYPDIGVTYKIDEQALAAGDKGVLQYLAEKGLVIGTLGTVATLCFKIVLKPVMHVVPTDPNPPSVSGFYKYNLLADPLAFININAIAAGDYPSLNNVVSYETEDRIIFGYAPANITQNALSLVMSDRLIPYKIPWVIFRGYMMIWSDLGVGERTVTFADVEGNRAYASPLIVLNNNTQATIEFLVADMVVELVSAGHNTVKLRLTRSHNPVAHTDFVNHVMTWLHDAAGGSPDPMDAGNPDKTVVTLSRGTYTFGVGTVYYNVLLPYPASAFSMVVEIY
jgi:hypothetical protein